MSKNQGKWNMDRLVGLSAMAISFITLLIFIYQTNLMSRQNYLSIMPYLSLSVTNNAGDDTFEMKLKNLGVGPAVIESVALDYKGERYSLTEYGNEFYEFLRVMKPGLDSLDFFSSATLGRGTAIPANTHYTILAVRNSEEDYYILREALQEMQGEGLDYEIIYKSIQGERWIIKNNTEEPEALH